MHRSRAWVRVTIPSMKLRIDLVPMRQVALVRTRDGHTKHSGTDLCVSCNLSCCKDDVERYGCQWPDLNTPLSTGTVSHDNFDKMKFVSSIPHDPAVLISQPSHILSSSFHPQKPPSTSLPLLKDNPQLLQPHRERIPALVQQACSVFPRGKTDIKA